MSLAIAQSEKKWEQSSFEAEMKRKSRLSTGSLVGGEDADGRRVGAGGLGGGVHLIESSGVEQANMKTKLAALLEKENFNCVLLPTDKSKPPIACCIRITLHCREMMVNQARSTDSDGHRVDNILHPAVARSVLVYPGSSVP